MFGSAIGYAMDGFDLLILGFMLRIISADLGLAPTQGASLVTATLGTSDDVVVNLNPWMTRTIAITPVTAEANLRQITITINYQVGRIKRTYTLISYISAFA